MSTNSESKDIQEILAEAEDLIQQIDFDVLNEMKEEHRLQIEIRAQKLEKLKFEIQGKIKKKDGWKLGSAAEGAHDAFQEIVKAMQDLRKYLS